ncbi:MAG: bifunctional 4-hydroxy-2-oxoglutarate aldolase/2-dehydro-3-deoxy-phosphogluconate aldolase [Pricia sp.]
MRNKKQIIDRIRSEKLIAILRLNAQESVQPAVDALVAGGMQVMEITTNTPGFAEEITKARERHPEMLIGAGTVTTFEMAQKVIAAGAQFLVTPNAHRKVAELGKAEHIPILMGAMTPTEVANALAFGADIIKLFPAGTLGIPHYQSLKGPFNDVPFFAVGGIDKNNIEDWLEVGIDGIGLGSGLVKSAVRTKADFRQVTTQAEGFRKQVMANSKK